MQQLHGPLMILLRAKMHRRWQVAGSRLGGCVSATRRRMDNQCHEDQTIEPLQGSRAEQGILLDSHNTGFPDTSRAQQNDLYMIYFHLLKSFQYQSEIKIRNRERQTARVGSARATCNAVIELPSARVLRGSPGVAEEQ